MLTHFGTLFAMGVALTIFNIFNTLWHAFCYGSPLPFLLCVCAREIVSRGTLHTATQNKLFHVEHNTKS